MADPYAGLGTPVDPYAGLGAPLKTFTVTKGGKPVTVQAPTKADALAQVDAQAFVKNSAPDALRAFNQGAAFGWADEGNALWAKGATGLNNLLGSVGIGNGAGYSGQQAYDAVMAEEKRRRMQYQQDHPVASTTLEIGGSLASPAGRLGAGYVAGARGVQAAGRAATVGGLAGAVYGAGSADPGQRAQGAKGGAVTGAVVGAAAPTVVKAAGGVGRGVVRLANKASGGKLLNPEQEAFARLRDALVKDGLTPDQITQAMNEWNRVGGPQPSFLNLVGENTKALVRGAASKGEGRAAAVKYGNRVAADLQDNAIGRTRQLTPDTRSVGAVEDSLDATRTAAADAAYAGPYRTIVSAPDGTGRHLLPPNVQQVLADGDGRAAINRALDAALVDQDGPMIRELQALLNGDGSVPISAGTLDRVRMGFREMGAAAAADFRGKAARGYMMRKDALDSILDEVPALQEARGQYRDISQQIEGLGVGQTGLRAMPDEFAAALQNPNIAATAPIGYRQAITDAIGAPTEGATGILNRLASSTNQGRNLAGAFGKPAAQDYRQSIGNMVDQVNDARFINPNTGSQTAGRLADESLVERIPTSKSGLVALVIQKLNNGVTITDAERAALVNIATEDAVKVPLKRLAAPPPLIAPRAVIPTVGLLSQPNQN